MLGIWFTRGGRRWAGIEFWDLSWRSWFVGVCDILCYPVWRRVGASVMLCLSSSFRGLSFRLCTSSWVLVLCCCRQINHVPKPLEYSLNGRSDEHEYVWREQRKPSTRKSANLYSLSLQRMNTGALTPDPNAGSTTSTSLPSVDLFEILPSSARKRLQSSRAIPSLPLPTLSRICIAAITPIPRTDRAPRRRQVRVVGLSAPLVTAHPITAS